MFQTISSLYMHWQELRNSAHIHIDSWNRASQKYHKKIISKCNAITHIFSLAFSNPSQEVHIVQYSNFKSITILHRGPVKFITILPFKSCYPHIPSRNFLRIQCKFLVFIMEILIFHALIWDSKIYDVYRIGIGTGTGNC